MANLPNSLNMNAPFGGPGGPNPTAAGTSAGKERKLASAEHLVLELSNPELRENALLELSKVIHGISSSFLTIAFPHLFHIFFIFLSFQFRVTATCLMSALAFAKF
ncbi:hypothetical protein LINPERPRIM_LOCUS38676 [Linum perenne]